MGFDVGKEFTNYWWDNLFNKAASNIVVEESKVIQWCVLRAMWTVCKVLGVLGWKYVGNAMKKGFRGEVVVSPLAIHL